MMKIMTVIFSLLLLVSCGTVRHFDLVGVSGGNVKDQSVLVENGVLKAKLVNFENDYDLIAIRVMIRNKSPKYLKLDAHQMYTKDPVGGVRYPLTEEQVFRVAASVNQFETPKEKMELRRKISSIMLKSGEIPPRSLVKGVLFFEPGRYQVREITLILRGIEADGAVMDFQNVVFQDEDYADDVRKVEAKKKARKRNQKKNSSTKPKKGKNEKPAEGVKPE